MSDPDTTYADEGPDWRSLPIPVVLVIATLGALPFTSPGRSHAAVALALLGGIPLVGRRLRGLPARLFYLAASLAVVGALHAWAPGESSLPIRLAGLFARLAIPPLFVDLLLTGADRDRLQLTPLHLYAPAAATGGGIALLVLAHAYTETLPAAGAIRWALAFYAICYCALLLTATLLRAEAGRGEPTPCAEPDQRAIDLEERGRFGMASRVYEREGRFELGAQAAEHAGEWARAARLYVRAGLRFRAGEMFFRAQQWPEALEQYEEAQAFPAAARLCIQVGDPDRAVRLMEQAGDPGAVVRILEEVGRRPTGEQYRKAGLMERAAKAFEAAGDWQAAADVYEHDLQDPRHAAVLHLKARSFRQAGRLLESQGRTRTALEAYASAPGGAIDAARLCLKLGRNAEAADYLGRLTPAELARLDDEATLTVVARTLVENGRVDDGLRILQDLKRRGGAGGAVHLLLGRAFLAKRLPELAEQELRTAATLPQEPADETRTAYLLGCLLEATGRGGEAMDIFQKILETDFRYADVERRYRRLRSPAGAGVPAHA